MIRIRPSAGSTKQTKLVWSRVTDDNLALFLGRVVFVRENPGQWVSKNRSSIDKTHAVLSQIPSRFVLVPFDYRGQPILLLGYSTGKRGEQREGFGDQETSPIKNVVDRGFGTAGWPAETAGLASRRIGKRARRR